MRNFKGLLFISITLLALSACGSINTVIKNQNNNLHSGSVYGIHSTDLDAQGSVKYICDKTGNKDARCSHQDDYKAVFVLSAFGYADGAIGVVALAPKEMTLSENCLTGSDKCSYLKASVEAGKLGTVEGIASVPGDKKCHWSGMPRIGGVVCPAYSWDYRKDNVGNSSHF
ncbi:hypothetical protein [Methyloradius palustris]|uniref:Lipoprotein n=1 Tax=Methyloradius palustris TaxID=2778876 RepID=A0A8D5FYZ0_9PROT|nr:hypothetical protein [Methyloradius palustris]BCM24320.1 hypothetical protein ZMTM_05790 [Methyloradius palustris]